jgi:hypothetical protein
MFIAVSAPPWKLRSFVSASMQQRQEKFIKALG